MKKVNLAKAIYNKNCLGYIWQYSNGLFGYQNDNDLGLDLEGIDYYIEPKKLFIYKRLYVYVLPNENIEDDGNGANLKVIKALLKECHKNFIPMSKKEQKLCKDYWGEY